MFWRRQRPNQSSVSKSRLDAGTDEMEVPRYPPFMQGLPLVSIDRIVASQVELIRRVGDTTIAGPSLFELHFLGPIHRFANFCHLLPASQSHHHRGAGGLFRHALEVGLWSLQAAQRVMLDSSLTPHRRRELEPRWQAALFLAALCHDAGKPVTDLAVTDREGASVWQPITDDLVAWATRNHVESYFLSWREGRGRQHNALSSLIAERIIGAGTLSWIAEAGTDPVVWLLESLSNNPGPSNPIHDLVIQADSASVERDMKTLGVAMAGYELGVPIERHIGDIMRRFVREGQWLVNVPGSRLWCLDEAIYLVWPAGGEELVRQIREDGIPGVPRTPDGLLDLLIERGIASTPNGDTDGGSLWLIAPTILTERMPNLKLRAIRIINEGLISSAPLSSTSGTVFGEGLPGSDAKSSETACEVVAPTVAPIRNEIPILHDTKTTVQSHDTELPVEAGAGFEREGVLETLRRLAAELRAGPRQLGDLAIVDSEGLVWLRWPDALAGEGIMPKSLLEELADQHCLVLDPLSPLKRTSPCKFPGGVFNAIGLVRSASNLFIAASGLQPEGQDSSESIQRSRRVDLDLVAPSSVAGSAESRDSRAPNQSVASLGEVLVMLRARGMQPGSDGFCRLPKKEVIRLMKDCGYRANHRTLWDFAKADDGCFILSEDSVLFKN